MLLQGLEPTTTHIKSYRSPTGLPPQKNATMFDTCLLRNTKDFDNFHNKFYYKSSSIAATQRLPQLNIGLQTSKSKQPLSHNKKSTYFKTNKYRCNPNIYDYQILSLVCQNLLFTTFQHNLLQKTVSKLIYSCRLVLCFY